MKLFILPAILFSASLSSLAGAEVVANSNCGASTLNSCWASAQAQGCKYRKSCERDSETTVTPGTIEELGVVDNLVVNCSNCDDETGPQAGPVILTETFSYESGWEWTGGGGGGIDIGIWNAAVEGSYGQSGKSTKSFEVSNSVTAEHCSWARATTKAFILDEELVTVTITHSVVSTPAPFNPSNCGSGGSSECNSASNTLTRYGLNHFSGSTEATSGDCDAVPVIEEPIE